MTQDRFSLRDRVAFVSGASAGLGAHFAEVLASAGAEVIVAARRTDRLNGLVNKIEASGGACSSVVLDVQSGTSIAALKDILPRVDILVNNAGIVREAPALEQTETDWDAVLNTNLKGMFLLASAFGRVARDRRRGGSIINIASILGLRQANNVLPYAVSKAGVIQLTKQLALEMARFGVRVNALAPGYLNTDLNNSFFESEPGKAMIRRVPQRRLGELTDLDGPLLLLASDASAYMTGSVVAVDGGHLVSTL